MTKDIQHYSYTESISGISLPCSSGYKHSNSTINVVNIPSENIGSENMKIASEMEIVYSKYGRRNQYSGLTFEERFWEKVDKKGKDECWEWKAHIDERGYGRIRYKGRWALAHRVSYIIHYGEISEDDCVLHKCDNRKCINPNHLFIGSLRDNVMDRDCKNRTQKGENHCCAKLTWNDISKIKELSKNYTQRQLAGMFNVSKTTICYILNNKTWKG